MARFWIYKDTAAFIERYSGEASLYLYTKDQFSNSVPVKGSKFNEHMNCKYKSPAYFKKKGFCLSVYLSQTLQRSVIRSIEFPINFPVLYESVNVVKMNENLCLFVFFY